jgi:RimJ/RimL family protein N-acetyltransferase
MAVEIAHVLVNPTKRWQGYGSTMIRLLFDRASRRPGILKVVINLHADNPEFLNSCANAGFELVGTPAGVAGLRMMRVVTR